MKTGASYYPELSAPEVWRVDLATARSLGLEVLRCGEFAWGQLSPAPDAWEMNWALEFLDIAREYGFEVVWCTPSASPPPYVHDRWPGLAAVNEGGQQVPVGIRRNYCPSHEGFRDDCAVLAGRLATGLASHPAVKGWQVDNEIAGDGFTCWCPRCQTAFQEWLEQRYGSLEELNRSWQTGVWSQHYSAWRQIPIPHKAFPSHAPSLKLAWRRFRSDNWLRFYRAQEQALREGGARQPVTTNFFDVTWDIPADHWAWRPHMDVMAQCLYVEDEVTGRFELALRRGLDDKPLWILEQKAGQQNAQNVYPESLGRIGRHLHMAAEAGVEFGTYWHLRQHRSGCEMEHGAVLRHDGKPTRIAQEIAAATRMVKTVPARLPAENRVLVFDFDQQWAQESRPQPGSSWDYREKLETDWYAAAGDLWQGLRIGPFCDALRQAGQVLAPHFQILTPEHEDALDGFLGRGGVLVTTADFGRLDEENNVRPLPPLGAPARWAVMPEGEMLHLKSGVTVGGKLGGAALTGHLFWFVPEDGTGVTHLRDADLSGPAWLEFSIGSGRLVVLTSAFDRDSLASLLPHVLGA